MTSTLDVGRRLVELCRAGKNLEAVDTLYAPDVAGIEPQGNEHVPARQQGIDAIRQRNQWWMDNHDIHGSQVDGPWPHGDRFVVTMKYDLTPRAGPFAGKRARFDEAALYTVRDGKVVQVEFFYSVG
jgi:ketosteroid isomerase-like protein